MYELDDLVGELRTIKEFLLHMTYNEDRLSVTGLRHLDKLEGFSVAILAITNLEIQITRAVRYSRFISPEISDRIKTIYESSPLLTRAAEINIAVLIASKKRTFVNLFVAFMAPLRLAGFSLTGGIFSDEGQIPIRRMLVDIERLVPLIEELSSLSWQQKSNDSEAFKPSGIDVERVKVFIDQALISIDSSTVINSNIKIQLSVYLTEAKTELASNAPAWKKIIGALIIVSTILSGLADSPAALANVKQAVDYILGTSIDAELPNIGPEIKRLSPPDKTSF